MKENYIFSFWLNIKKAILEGSGPNMSKPDLEPEKTGPDPHHHGIQGQQKM